MIRTFILEDLCCPNCAKKIQERVNALDGVSECTVSFLTSKMTYEVSEEKNDAVEAAMIEIVKDVDGDVTIEAK